MHQPLHYRSVPTEIEAIQWTGTNPYAVRAFTGETDNHFVFATQDGIENAELYVAANKSWVHISVGEWVAKDELGFYPIKDEVFKKKYRQINNRGDFVPPYDR